MAPLHFFRFPILVWLGAAAAASGQTARAVPGPATAPTADDYFAKGVDLHQTGDILGAIEAYELALKLEHARVDARSNLGAAYVRLGRYEDAVREYTKALEIDPEQPRVRFNLGLALYKSARTLDAARELERVVAQDVTNTAALLLLADCQLQMGQDARVIGLLEPHEKALGQDRLYCYLLGNAYLRRNEFLRGQTFIDRLFREGDTAEARLLMGVAHLRREDPKSALPELQRAIELDPKLPSVHALHGRALMGVRQRPESGEAFRRELQNNPNDFDSNLYLGLLMKDENRLDEAYDHLKRAGRLRPRDARVLYGLGSLHLLAGRVDEAQKALEAVTAEVPEYVQAHVLLATVYYRQKRKELGDRHKAIAEKLQDEQQAKEPGARDDLGPAYRGEDLPPEPSAPPPPKKTTKEGGDR